MATTVNPTIADVTIRRAKSSSAWVFGGLILLLTLAIYSGELHRLYDTWLMREDLSYGILVPPVAAYSAWLQRKRIFGSAAETDLRGLFAVGAACALFLTGRLGAEFFLIRTSLVLLLAGLIWTFWGRQRLQALAFPLILLESSIPLPMLVYN